VNVRRVLNGIFYVFWTGCRWKALNVSGATVPTTKILGGRSLDVQGD
jgi:transposase